MIDGLITIPLKIIEDERGSVLHMLRADSPFFTEFGEIYFSQTNVGIIKGWKRHKKMTQRFAVPFGRIKVVIYDDRTNSKTLGEIDEIILGRPDQYQLLIIPPKTWYGFQSLSGPFSILANCSDLLHDPAESEQLPLNTNLVPYQW